jgi:hypothetical protein
VTAGAALLGWVAGEMAVTDPILKDWVEANAGWLDYGMPAAGALGVVAVGSWFARRREAEEEVEAVVDLATADQPGKSSMEK